MRTAHQSAELVVKCGAIRHQLQSLRTVQAIYMPCVPRLLAQHLQSLRQAAMNAMTSALPATGELLADHPEDLPLFLPNEISDDDLERCSPDIAKIEEHLREVQLRECLDKLRVQLHIKSCLVTHKNRNVRGQVPNLRARRQLDVNGGKIEVIANKYRYARVAKLKLSGPGPWERKWRVLARTDVRTMLAEDDPANKKAAEQARDLGAKGTHRAPLMSEGRRTVSWIWMAADRDELDETGMQDGASTLVSSLILMHS